MSSLGQMQTWLQCLANGYFLFGDAGGGLVEWLMNGTSFAAPPAVMGTIAVDYAIAAHHFDVV